MNTFNLTYKPHVAGAPGPGTIEADSLSQKDGYLYFGKDATETSSHGGNGTIVAIVDGGSVIAVVAQPVTV